MDDDTSTFLHRALDKMPAGMQANIWTLPDKTSYWIDSADAAIAAALKQSALNADVYLAVGWADRPYSRKQRTPSNEVAGLFGLWADIDYLDPVHKKPNLPTQTEALAFIATLRQPTFIIHSGHGYQLWWMFEEPWITTDPEQRQLAAATARAWIYDIRDKARKQGWDIDATIDLARVMRVPGTLNHKSEPAVPVTIIEASGVLYHPRDFPVVALPLPYQGGAVNTLSGRENGTYVIDVGAGLPARWDALATNRPEALASFRRQRVGGDLTPSGYDLSLASFAVYAGWTNQEVVDLMVAARVANGEDLKLRPDYFDRTLQRAHSGLDTVSIDETIAGFAEVMRESVEGVEARGTARISLPAAEPLAPPSPRYCAAVLAALGGTWGCEIKSFVKFLEEPPIYTLTIIYQGDERAILIPNVEIIMNQRQFRARLAGGTNVIVAKCSEAEWEIRAQRLLDCAEEVELGSHVDEVDEWLTEYLDANKPSKDWAEAVKVGRPYFKGEMVCVQLLKVSHWLRIAQGEKMTTRELARWMKVAGWERTTQFTPGDEKGGNSTRAVWQREAAGFGMRIPSENGRKPMEETFE